MFDHSVSYYIQTALLGGLLGTGAMTLVLNIIHKKGLANSDMVRAIGSLFTKSYDNSFVPGIVFHFISGVFFAVVYSLIVNALNPTGFTAAIGYSTGIGMFHGAAVGLLLEVIVAEHHPVEQFQKAGIAGAAAHWFAHVVYGLIVGIVIAVINF